MGPTLADRIAQGPVPLDEALPIAQQIAEALEAAHEQGIIHRDLKPANIKIRGDGAVKVLDFGLAKAIESAGAVGLAGAMSRGDLSHSPTITSPEAMTRVGVILGTAAYMAPEQARGRQVDRRADVWAFGCVLFELLAGRRAFPGEDVTDTLAAVMRAEPDWTLLERTAPLALRSLVARCLKKDVRMRTQAVGDVRVHIDELIAGKVEEPNVGAETRLSPSERYQPRATWWRAVPWGLAAAGVVVAATAMAMRPPQSPVAAQQALTASITPPPGVFAAFNRGFALSPDGQILAFTARDQQGLTLLWLRDMRTGDAKPIAATRDAAFPFWSPDGQHVGFWSDHQIKRVPAAGGVAQSVAPAPAHATLFRGAAWLIDDSIVFSDSTGLLSRVPASGGTPAKVAGLGNSDDVLRVLWPKALPDGPAVLAGIEFRDSTRSGIHRIDVNGSSPQRIVAATFAGRMTAVPIGPRRLAWVDDGGFVSRAFDGTAVGQDPQLALSLQVSSTAGWARAVASADGERLLLGLVSPLFSAGANAPQTIWVDRKGGAMGDARANSQALIRLAPDGRRAAVTRVNDLWVVDTTRSIADRITSSAETESQPMWSSDGRRIAYRQLGVTDLFVVDLENKTTERFPQAFPLAAFVGGDWSSDGRHVVGATAVDKTATNLDLVSFDLTTREATRLTTTPFSEFHPRFSPDGKYIAFASDETGTREVYLRRLEVPAARRVSTAGGDFPVWRADGRDLVYVSPTGTFMSVDMGPMGLPSGDPIALFTLEPRRDLPDQAHFDMTPDGRRFLIAPEPPSEPLTLIDHWLSTTQKASAP